MTTEHRENRSLPIRTAVEPASLLPLSAHMSYGQMRMALYNVAPDLQVSPRAQSFAHFGLHPGDADGKLDAWASGLESACFRWRIGAGPLTCISRRA